MLLVTIYVSGDDDMHSYNMSSPFGPQILWKQWKLTAIVIVQEGLH